MKESIADYIEFLRDEYGLRISLHGGGLTAALDSLAPYNTHECVYCMYVKGSSECWDRCKESQRRAERRARDGAFFGSCYAGVGEFVFPIESEGKIYGIISVGGYVGSAQKRAFFAKKYGFHEQKLSQIASAELKTEIPDLKFLKTVITPLAAMLSILIRKEEAANGHKEEAYGKILSIIHSGYSQKIRISDIAAKCHYSVSFVGRLFKENSGISLNKYLFNLRMQKAKELILDSNMRIEDVACAVGFSDTNYFISAFSKYYKAPPKKYRNANKSLQKSKKDSSF
jgi:AraC-like DNA-binding protein